MYEIDTRATRGAATMLKGDSDALHACSTRLTATSGDAIAAAGADSAVLTREIERALHNFARGFAAMGSGIDALALDVEAVARDADELDAAVAGTLRDASCFIDARAGA